MHERDVVTVFLREGAEVLLLRRSDAVGSYPGRWGGVAGHVEDSPEASARREIREETGMTDAAVSLVRSGEPFEVVDEEAAIAWTVHPFLFDARTRAVRTNWETAAAVWVHPTAILHRETVPELWTSYDRVRPRLTTVESDSVHGAAYISLRALEVLRDEAAVRMEAAADSEGPVADRSDDWTALRDLGLRLRDARPGMAVVANRVNEVMAAAATDGTPPALYRAAVAGIERATDADAAAAGVAADLIDGRAVFTLSRSGTVRAAIERSDPSRVLVAVSEPGGEGREVAATLADAGEKVTLTSDANVPAAVEAADVVLVGADSVLPSGDVVNKVGTRAAMLAARAVGTETLVVCAAAKVRADDDVELEPGDPTALYDGPAQFSVSNPIFERTTGELVDGIATERGRLDPDDVAAIAAEYAAAAAWPE